MSNNILFVFEGEKTEKQITDNFSQYFLDKNTLITCAFCNNLYQLYEEIVKDEDLDTFFLLKEKDNNKVILEEFNREDFAEIYMFFDYDGHDTQANDEKIKQLLDFFYEETDKGKLYISYPMVESLKHFIDFETFQYLKVLCKINVNYKKLVSEDCLKSLIQFKKYDIEVWKLLCVAHLQKMNFIVNDIYVLPNSLILQIEIFEKQLSKYINVNSTVGVLSAFPIFLHDYFGNEGIKQIIK